MDRPHPMGDAPALGNVLGFSLLIRDRKALLRLDQRTLSPGLSLHDYEAELPDEEFPLETPPSLSVFQHRRCRARHLTLHIDAHAVATALEARLVGRTLDGLAIERVALEPVSPYGPMLRIDGRTGSGAWSSHVLAFALQPVGHELELQPRFDWRFGEVHGSPPFWAALAGPLGGTPTAAGAVRLDPSRGILTRAFASAGWKAPDVSELAVTRLEVGAHRCQIRFEHPLEPPFEQGATPPAPASDGDSVGHEVSDTLAKIHRRLAHPEQLAEGLAMLEVVCGELRDVPLAEVASLAWLADRLRHASATISDANPRALAAVERWLALAPRDPLARRLHIELLARTHRYRELVRVGTQARDATVDEGEQLEHDIALAQLYGSKLGDREQALERLRTWSGRAPGGPVGQRLQLALARIEAGDPSQATATLDAVLPTLEDPEQRFAERLGVAIAMAEAEKYSAAGALLGQLLEQGTRDPQNRAELRALATRLGEHGAALELLRAELADIDLRDAEARATELALHACAASHPDAIGLVVAALAREPDDPDLLRWSARLHERAGDLDSAAGALERLAARSPTSAEINARLARLLFSRGQQHLDRGDPEAAEADWAHALTHLPPNTPMHTKPALFVASRALGRNDTAAAIAALRRVLSYNHANVQAWSLLARAAAMTNDTELAIEAGEALLGRTDDADEQASLRLDLAALHEREGRLDEALELVAAATRGVPVGSGRHLELAEAWLGLARKCSQEPTHERQARAELRRALGPDLPADALCTEAALLANELGAPTEAIDLLAQGLRERPAHPLLLARLGELCRAHDALAVFAGALRTALDRSADPQARDALALDLAATAQNLEQPELALEALECLTTEATRADRALDVRDWAVHHLGREDQERATLEQQLLHDPYDGTALARLRRMSAKGDEGFIEQLMALTPEAKPAVGRALLRQAISLARSLGDHSLLTRTLRKANDFELDGELHEPWQHALDLSLEARDERGIADLLLLAARRGPREPAIAQAFEGALDHALALLPRSDALLRLAGETPGGHLAERARRVSRAHALGDEAQADLWVGLADRLTDRRLAVALLSEAADHDLNAPSAFDALCSALLARGQFAEAIRLIERRIQQTKIPGERHGALKRLATIHANYLGDSESATRALQLLLDDLPYDEEVLLPLIESSFERHELGRAVELSTRALEHVAMGEAAYDSLLHRAVDAAIAQGDLESARALLLAAIARFPDEAKHGERLAELDTMQENPEQRVQVLAMIAARRSGPGRIEALEERAKLLADPLGRPERAILDLEAILAEDPEHAGAGAQLEALYARTGRWRELVAFLERRFLREQGVARCQTLQAIAEIHRRELLDLPRAEQALRLALDHVGDAPEHRDLAERMRAALISDIQHQGRFVDLSIYLSRALAPELEGTVAAANLHPGRVALLVELARIFRGPLDDEGKAARVYERLEAYDRLPEEGLATLARAYRRAGRHADLVRVLKLRAEALGRSGDARRKASVDVRIAELLEGPVGHPHEAAVFYLEAYLADPSQHAAAGSRARVLFSGVDAVANVRRRLLARARDLPPPSRPALLTLLGDVLSPHDDYETEAEQRYRQALELDPHYGPACDALGRLMARLGRLDAAVGPLSIAAAHPAIDPTRAAEDAAIAARAFLELQRPGDAEAVLKAALQRAPDSQRALLELARLYERLGRSAEQAMVLEELADLPLSSGLASEVAYRRGVLLLAASGNDPFSAEAERARTYLLAAVNADSKHAGTRQALLVLAQARLEWSIVAHMHYLAIRELPNGPQRALVHLDLAETYLHHLHDPESATRNIESALAQAPADLVVTSRAGALAGRLPEPRKVAERFERIASVAGELDPPSRARLWLLAADLRLATDDPAAAEAASQAVLDLQGAPPEALAAAQRNLELLAFDEARDLRQQKSGLMRLLEAEELAAERMHILRRLREIGVAMDDRNLIEWASREQLGLAVDAAEFEPDLSGATTALRELYAERGSYEEIVALYRGLASRLRAPQARAEALLEAARFTRYGLRNPTAAIALLQEVLAIVPAWAPAMLMLGELTRQCEDPELQASVYRTLIALDAKQRPITLELELGRLARALGRTSEAIALLRPLTAQGDDARVRVEALRDLKDLLSTSASPAELAPVLRRYLDEAHNDDSENWGEIASELADLELALGNREGALQSVRKGLLKAPEHLDLMRLEIRLLEATEQWDALARALERMALHTSEPDDQGALLVRAARIRIDHQSSPSDPNVRKRAIAEARRLLLRASEATPKGAAARAELLPISFSEGRWDEVLELALTLRSHGQDDEEALILAALTEAYRHGQRSLARDLGFRHDPKAHRRYLYPGLRQLLTEVATKGPLPRLDALVAAAATLAGGRPDLAEGIRAWAAGRPIQIGLALGLARLAEADGQAEVARSLYQISAFMAPAGPVRGLVSRLPLATPPDDLDPQGSSPRGALGGGVGPLQLAMAKHASALGGLPRPGLVPAEESSLPLESALETRFALANTILEPWRRHFRRELPLVWSDARLPGGVGAGGDPPVIFVGASVRGCSLAELRYRLAYACGGIILGTLPLDCEDPSPGDQLETLRQRLRTSASVENAGACGWVRLADLVAGHERRALAEHLDHALAAGTSARTLVEELTRARMLFACRLSGQLDGALATLAHDQGLLHEGRPDPLATLRHADAHWLLQALGLY